MIIFQNWQISAPPDVIARQYDNLSRTLQVTGELPEGYTWDLLVKVDKAMDIIPLEPVEGGVGVTLTADQLSLSGYYQMQLRGTLGDVVRHTNVITTFIPASLSGDGPWPAAPSKFTKIEQTILELNAHPPKPGEDGYWQVWDAESHCYVGSEFPMPDYSPKWMTFEVDPAAGTLIQTATAEDSQANFTVNDNGYLEVSIRG